MSCFTFTSQTSSCFIWCQSESDALNQRRKHKFCFRAPHFKRGGTQRRGGCLNYPTCKWGSSVVNLNLALGFMNYPPKRICWKWSSSCSCHLLHFLSRWKDSDRFSKAIKLPGCLAKTGLAKLFTKSKHDIMTEADSWTKSCEFSPLNHVSDALNHLVNSKHLPLFRSPRHLETRPPSLVLGPLPVSHPWIWIHPIDQVVHLCVVLPPIALVRLHHKHDDRHHEEKQTKHQNSQ